MLNLSSVVTTLLKNFYRQTATITLTSSVGTTTITEANIVKNSLSVNRYSVSGTKLEIGSATAAELKFSLDNTDGTFDSVVFEGSELYAKLNIAKWGSTSAVLYTIPLGYFIIEENPRRKRTIQITALDRMRKFDRLVDTAKFTAGATVGSFINTCCSACGVTLATGLSSQTNIDYTITTLPEDFAKYTYRQVIQWCAAILGTCAYIDWNGLLRFEWYTDNEDCAIIAKGDRYSSDIYEKDITVTGVTATIDDVAYTSGTTDYAFDLSDNPLIQHDVQGLVDNLGAKLTGFSYRPYSCEVKPMPQLYPMDEIVISDNDGKAHYTIITDVTFKMNSHTELKAQGETETTNSYYTPTTNNKQAVITAKIEKTQKEHAEKLQDQSEKLTLAYNLNNVIGNALGLYVTTVTDDNGGIQYYFHDGATLAESTIIYTFNSGGFAWTDAWNDGSPIWNYGITKDGNAVLNYLSVNKLTADYINVQSLVASSEFVATATDSDGNVTTLFSINSNGIAIDSTYFKLTTDGYITATGGTIGGFTIGDSALYNGVSSQTLADGTEGVYVGTDGINVGGGNFTVSKDGTVAIKKGSIQIGYINTDCHQVVTTFEDGGFSYSETYPGEWTYSRSLEVSDSIGGLLCKRYSNDLYIYDKLLYLGTMSYDDGSSFSIANYLCGYPELNIEVMDEAGLPNSLSAIARAYICMKYSNSQGQIEMYASKGSLSGTWTSASSIAVSSDENLKNTIEDLTDKYTALFDELRPVRFKYNDGTSGRYHTGFVAQEVSEAVATAGLDSDEFAAYLTVKDDEDNLSCCLRYEEFIALCVNEIQKLKQRVKELENETL